MRFGNYMHWHNICFRTDCLHCFESIASDALESQRTLVTLFFCNPNCKRFVQFKFSCWINMFCAILRKFLRSEQHVTVLSSFNWGIRYLTKRHTIAREHKIIWPSADKRAWSNGIWQSTAECAMTNFLRNLILANANTKELDKAQTNGHDGIWPSTAKCQWLSAENIDRAHALTRASKKFLKDFFCSESIRDEKKMTFVKNSNHPRLSATAKRRKGALLMVHSARTLTVPLRASR